MNRTAPGVAAIAVTILVMSSPALYAQRGGGGGARTGGHARDGARGGARDAHQPAAPATPIPSADHPLPYNFNAVKPAPLLGREPIPAPFAVPPGYYNRRHPLASIPYAPGYGYAAPDDQETDAPGQDLVGPATAPHPRELPPAETAPVVTPPVVAVAPHPPQTMYVITGCYGGNVPPMRAKLPKGCDIAKLRVLRPPQ